jgi:curli biogenesis system outer membrane secretion channel CsgG
LKTLAVVLLAVTATGCSTVHYTVSSAPVRPEDTGRFAVANPEVPVRVHITNFEIRQVDTQYPEREKELFRRHNSVAIANILQEFLGKRQVFAEVTRTTTAKPNSADYVITGTYNFFERIGTQGREWIPFAGTFGASINEATIRGTLSLRIVESKGGTVVFEKVFPEEHTERTSIYKKANVGYLQADYMGQIASEVIKAISGHRTPR